MTAPLVTVLMPVLNGMPFLPDALASLEAQTFRDFEVLAWDNGSNDGSVEELRRWIPSRIPGTIVADRPLPLAECLATMVLTATTELCARFDADDLCHPERLQRQVNALNAQPTLAVLGTQIVAIHRGGMRRHRQYPVPLGNGAIRHRLRSANALHHPTVMFRRSAVLAAGNYRPSPHPEIHFEDLDLWLRIAAPAQLGNLPDALVQYRIHRGSVMGKARRRGSIRAATLRCIAEATTDGPKRESAPVSFLSILKAKLRRAQLMLAERRLRVLAWRSGSWIHRSVELRGSPDVKGWVAMGHGCCADRQLSVWLADTPGAQPELTLGDRVYLGRNVFVNAFMPITLGNDVMIGAYSYLTSGNHAAKRRDLPMREQGHVGAPIVLEDDVWLGANVTVLPGAYIERGAVIGAGSVVTGRVPGYEIWGGVPAKFLKHRD